MASALIGILHFSTGPLRAADELLKNNADFEEWNQQTLFPKNWRDNPAYNGKIKIITKKKDVHDGEGSVLVENEAGGSKETAIVYGSDVPVLSDQKCHFKIWARGTGKIMLHIYQYSAEGTPIIPESNEHSKFFELTDRWEEYSFDYIARSEDPVAKVRPAIHVKGEAYLDDASFMEGELHKGD